MKIFEAVVRHRTVTEAAIALEMAPSSVSAQIRGLEKVLEVELFVRTAKGMHLTERGQRLLEWSRRLLEQAERARQEVAGSAKPLQLGALETLAATYVPGVLARLNERRPGLDVRVTSSGRRDELMADVAAARLDATLLLDTGRSLGGLGFPAPDLAYADIETVPLALVAAPGHPLSGRPDLAASDLAGERLLINAPGCSFYLAAEQAIGPGPERVPAGGVPVMRAWAEQGLGISLLPEFAVGTALESGALARLALVVPDLDLRLVWRADREADPAVRDLLYAATPHRA